VLMQSIRRSRRASEPTNPCSSCGSRAIRVRRRPPTNDDLVEQPGAAELVRPRTTGSSAQARRALMQGASSCRSGSRASRTSASPNIAERMGFVSRAAVVTNRALAFEARGSRGGLARIAMNQAVATTRFREDLMNLNVITPEDATAIAANVKATDKTPEELPRRAKQGLLARRLKSRLMTSIRRS
jgi:hypothetical protein